MKSCSALDRRTLKERAEYFFTTRVKRRGEVADFARALSELGEVVVIGGCLRDLLLSGSRTFTSDVDFVVDPGSMAEFEHLVASLGGQRNRFGGYGIQLTRWKVDVWPLERTWAAVHRHASVQSLSDLTRITFFDWDALVYSVSRRSLATSTSYFERVRSRVIDINLEHSPNPAGNAVRAVRYAYRWDAALGPGLAEYVARRIHDDGWNVLVGAERAKFPNPILQGLNESALWRALKVGCRSGDPVTLPMKPVQPELPLGQGSPFVWTSQAAIVDASW
jgi:hypothetical protein